MYSGNGARAYKNENNRVEQKTKRSKEKTNEVIQIGSLDQTTFLVILILVCFGVAMIFSAGYHTIVSRNIGGGDTYFYLKRQGLFAAVGIVTMLLVSKIDYRLIARFGFMIYLASNVLLIFVALTAVATNGAKRWIELPIIGRFQPSELSKVAIIFLISGIIYKNRNILKKWSGFIFCCGVVGVTMLLVLLGNLSTALIIGIIGFGIIFVASPHVMRFVVAGAGAIGVLVSYIAFFSSGFRGERFDAWLNPFADPKGYGFQIIQSLYAIASGGLFGVGLGASRQKSFIPEPHNDFIFAIICEELGAIVAGLLLLLFGVLIWRGVKIAINATDTLGTYIATGIVLMIASQVVINVAVVTNSIPNTGVPLPFISYGGTAFLITMFLMGVLLNISRNYKE